MLYACSQRLGAFVERLAVFRPDPIAASGVAAVAGGGGSPPGRVPATWLTTQMLGEATPVGRYAFVGHSRSLAFVRSTLASRLAHYGLADLDAATIRLSTPRRFTQEISRLIYETTTQTGLRFAGIRYSSRLGDDFANWAVFESDPAPMHVVAARAIDPSDPDLQEACELLGIELV